MREALRAQIEKAAKTSGNSMNQEMVQRLEETFREEAEWRVARSLALALGAATRRAHEGDLPDFIFLGSWYVAALDCIEALLDRMPLESSMASKAHGLISVIANHFGIKVEHKPLDKDIQRHKLFLEIGSAEATLKSLKQELLHLDEEWDAAADEARRARSEDRKDDPDER
jgi:hypothetical protein